MTFRLKDLFLDLLRPRDAFGWIALGLVALKPFSYWIVFQWINPEAEVSLHLLYRGDFGVFPLIRAFSELNFGEAVVLEPSKNYVMAYPVVCLLPHALAYRLIGPLGYLVADLLIALALYALLGVLLRVLGLSRPTAVGASLLVLAFAGYEQIMSKKLFGFLFVIYDWRLPRPFVSQLFFIACLTILLCLWHCPTYRKRFWTWCLLGFTAALLATGDPWTWMVFITAFGMLLIYMAVTKKLSLTQLLSRTASFLACGLLGGLPLIIQKIYEHPDIGQRIGVITLSRTAAFHQLPPKSFFYVALVVSISLIVARTLNSFRELEDKDFRIRGIQFVAVLSAIAYATPLTSVILTGQAIQHWHFRTTLATVMSLTIMVLGLNLWDLGTAEVLRMVQHNKMKERVFSLLARGCVVLVMMLSLWGMFQAAYSRAAFQHAKEWCPEEELGTEAQTDFIRLANELTSREYENVRVIGSFDYQVIGWWASFMGGRSYLADTTTSTLSDEEIEGRLIAFCKLIGMTADQFVALVQQQSCNYLWLGHAKYEVFRYHTFAKLWDYNVEDQQRILDIRRIESGLKVIPNSEKARLVTAFNSSEVGDKPRLDLVILTKHNDLDGLHPPLDTFRLVYQNPTFTVWMKREILDFSPQR